MGLRGDVPVAPPLLDLLRCPLYNERATLSDAAVTCSKHVHRSPVVDGIAVFADEKAFDANAHYGQQQELFDREFARYRTYTLEGWRLSYQGRLRSASLLGTPGAPSSTSALPGHSDRARAFRIHDSRRGHLRRYEAEGLIDAARSMALTPVNVQFTGHAIKVLQLAVATALTRHGQNRFWRWCEGHDPDRAQVRRGCMQLSGLFRRDG